MSLSQKNEFIQGTPEWLALRKKHITATDSSIIMGASHWKTKIQLYNEKTDESVKPLYINERMQRGLDLEPIARDYFTMMTGIKLIPKDDPRNVVIHSNGWMMASFDGISECGDFTLEIKCPGDKDHHLALQGKIPEHYYPQNQHQIEIKRPKIHFYLSFDGFGGKIIEVEKNDKYITEMLVEEKKFYDCIVNKTPPELSETDYLLRQDEAWQEYAEKWRNVNDNLKRLEKEEEELRKKLISLSGDTNCRGYGISTCLVKRKGNVDYSAIPELKNLDLEKYRKNETRSWRITIWN